MTSVVEAAESPSAARSTCSTIGSPPSGCSTFGRADFIRVPLPAASTTTWSWDGTERFYRCRPWAPPQARSVGASAAHPSGPARERGRRCGQGAKGLGIAEGVEVRVEGDLGRHVRPERDRLAQRGQSLIPAAAPSVNRGRQVQRQILIGLLGKDRLNEPLGTGLVAVVEGSRGRRQTLLCRRRLRRLPPQLSRTEVEVDPGAVQQGPFSRKSCDERVERLRRVRVAVALKGLHPRLKDPDSLWRRQPCRRKGRRRVGGSKRGQWRTGRASLGRQDTGGEANGRARSFGGFES